MTRLVADGCWKELTSAAKSCRGPAYVAVAYFGKGAAKLLPLSKGSGLVVDASEAAVKSGQTHPDDLKELLLKRGVRIFSASNLHSKVFVFGKQAFIGSANASQHSASTLIEALLVTSERTAVVAAKQFVDSLCLVELGPEELSRLQKKYRPPRIPGGGAKKPRIKANTIARIELPKHYIAVLTSEAEPKGSEAVREAGRKAAERRMDDSGRHKVDYFWIEPKDHYPEGVQITQVWEREKGHFLIYPPATVLDVRQWRSGRESCKFVHLEMPRTRARQLKHFAQALGVPRKELKRDHLVSRDLSMRILAAWNN